jgi:hypothetical protein
MDPREKEIRIRQCQEIHDYARGKMAEKLKSKFAPPAPAEDEPLDAAPAEGDALDQESLSRLAAMAE